MISLNRTAAKTSSGDAAKSKPGVRRQSGSTDKWFCSEGSDPKSPPRALHEVREDDLKHRADAMEEKDSGAAHPAPKVSTPEVTALDDAGFKFIRRCIALLEGRGLEDQGLYRLVGVSSRVNRLLAHGLDPEKMEKLVLDDPLEWENKTVTSAIKTYFRNLPEPLVTHRLHNAFLDAAKLTNKNQRIVEIAALVGQLPRPHYEMLKLLIQHLVRVASKSHSNLMSVGNLGVCFGPTLFRPEEDTMAAIMDIRFCNLVVEILITNAERIFSGVLQRQCPPVISGSSMGVASAAASVAASAAAATASAGGDVSLFERVSKSTASSSSPASTPQPPASSRRQSPEDRSNNVKRPPTNSSSHSSLVSALSLAPVTHTIVTSYNVETPRPVLMECNYGGQRKARASRESRLSTQALFEALPSHNSTLSSASSSPMFSSDFSYRTSSSAPSSANAMRRNLSPTCRGGEKAVNRTMNPSMSTSVESLAATGYARRRHGPELRSVHEDSIMGETKDSDARSSYRVPLFSCVGSGINDRAKSGCANSTRKDLSEARKRLFYRDTAQPLSLLDLRSAGASTSGVPSVLMSKSMEEDPAVVPLRNGGAALSGTTADGQAPNVGTGAKSKPPSLAFRPNPLLNLLNSSSSSTESLSSARSSKEPSTSPKSRSKLGFPNPPKYRSQEPFILRSKLGGGLSSFTSSGACGLSCGQGSPSSQQLRRVRTLFACVGENEAELSFEPNQIITNVRPSKEPGWLEGTLNGHQGLVPENYVEYLP